MAGARRSVGGGRSAVASWCVVAEGDKPHEGEDMLRWRLGEVVRARALSQREVARRSGLTRNTIDRLVKTTTLVRIEGETLARLCAALDIQPGELITRHVR